MRQIETPEVFEAKAESALEVIKLKDLTRSELKQIAKQKKLKDYEFLTNSQLVELIHTGKITEIQGIKKPVFLEGATFKINNEVINSLPTKTSIANIRAIVRSYQLQNNIEKIKDITLTLPNGTKISADKVNTLRNYITDTFRSVVAGNKTDEASTQQLNALKVVVKHANTLPISWDKLGTNDTKLSKAMFMEAGERLQDSSAVTEIDKFIVLQAMQTLKLLK